MKALVTIAFLALVVAAVDEELLLARIAQLDPAWVAVALVATLPQYLLSAMRWRLTAARLGVSVPFKTAVAEYYLATLTNQLLPGGVIGDAARAYRHGRRLRQDDAVMGYGPAIRAVVFERAAGQFVLFLVMVAGLVFWPESDEGANPLFRIVALILLVAAIAVFAMALLLRGPLARTRFGTGTRRFVAEARYAVLAREVIWKQAFYSFAILATYLFCFYCAARSLGIALSFNETVSFIPAILFAMTLPLTIGGWGIREAMAASIWGLADLTPADGVAASVTYGIIVLLSALPGIFFVLPRLQRDVGNER